MMSGIANSKVWTAFMCKHAGCGRSFAAYSARSRHQNTCRMRPQVVEEGAEGNEKTEKDG